MFSRRTIFATLVSLGCLLSVASGVAVAQMPHLKEPTISLNQTTQFQRIKQPLELKTGVTLGGIALIGLELWWFLFSRIRNSTVEGEDLTRRIDN